jgi:gamma-glutamylcyclotransferase (GGCT)/AIG2-like uncharacterized protein YtfP|tara:strand:+ start:1040 stop:1465 length:426 start_codon:yes stop_codon:yes gene_type:complete
MTYYFAYGSNLHHAQMKRRCPKCKYIKKFVLNNFQLTFRNKGGWADIEKKVNKKVYGALYIISKCAETRLDKYEDYPIIYKKMYFKYKGKKVMTYTMVRKTKLIPPTTRYLNIIKQGYKDCKINIKSLDIALLPLKHLQRR